MVDTHKESEIKQKRNRRKPHLLVSSGKPIIRDLEEVNLRLPGAHGLYCTATVINVLKSVASTEGCRSLLTNSLSENDLFPQFPAKRSAATAVLKLEICQVWESIPKAIICMGASHIYPSLFNHYALLVPLTS